MGNRLTTHNVITTRLSHLFQTLKVKSKALLKKSSKKRGGGSGLNSSKI